VVGLPPGRSHELLERASPRRPSITTRRSAVVHTTVPGNPRLAGERAEPIPYRRLERVAQLLVSGPPLDVDELVAVQAAQHGPVDPAAAPGAAAERNHGDGGAAPRRELIPDRRPRQELQPAWA